ncbi:MAG: VCBS repeat-containing protein, partial [Actinobacteria bacterium]|nr:VCBS repeat-containing protein [Actinomycetota bacterium]
VLILSGGPRLSAADCNGNGDEDDAEITAGSSADCNGNRIPDECELLPIELAAAGAVRVSDSPRVLRSGDIDGDGDTDLIVGGRTTAATHSTVIVLANRGGRVFEVYGEVRVGANLVSLAAGDLDGDGDVDIATAHGETLSVLLNDGGGGFGAATTIDAPEATRFIVTADVNGDGIADLITANDGANSVSVLGGAPGGTLTHIGDFPVAGTPIVVTTGDLDGDSDLDLAVLGRRSRSVSVLLNAGDGTFAPEVSYRIASGIPADAVTGDFDGDGSPDIAATTSEGYSVLLNDGRAGFAGAVNYPGAAGSMRSGDLDGDGDVDLAITVLPNLVSVKVNDGTGRFGVFLDSSSPGFPSSMVLDDFDADGRLDAAVAAGDIAVLWNSDGKVFFVTIEVHHIEGCERAGQGCQPHVGGVADVDGDGDIDAIGLNTNPGSFTHLINDGSGNMEQRPPHTFGGEEHLAMRIGDLDGDGDPDVVTVEVLEHDAWVLLYRGNGVYEKPVRYPVAPGGAPIDVALGDLDGDGDLDIVTANQGSNNVTVLFNRGPGTFDREGLDHLRVGSRPLGVITADLDGDGDVDIAAANAGSSQVSVLLNEGARSFAPARHYRLTGNPHHLAHGDFNHDGRTDLVTANDSTSSCTVLFNRGDGTFPDAADYAIGRAPYSLAVVDFDVDGIEDLVTANADTGSVSVFRGRGTGVAGDGTFDAPVHIEIGRGTALRFAYPADFDRDGDPDLVTMNRLGRSMTMVFNESSPVDTADYLETVCTPVDFQQLSVPSSSTSAAERFVKWTLAATDSARLEGAVYQNTRRYALHEEFLVRVFPDLFPALEPEVYDSLVGRRASRQYFVGTVSRIRTDAGRVYGFSVFARFDDGVERLSLEEVESIYDRLRASFHPEPLVYFPNTRAAIEVAEAWENPRFEIFFSRGGPATSSYEPYTIAVGYGTVRLLDAEAFEESNSTGRLSFQDILVLDQAPRDIEG